MQDVEKWFLLVWAHFTPKCKVSYDIVTQYYCSMLYKYKDSWNRNERFLNTQKTSQLLKKGSSAKSRKNSSCCHENFCCLEKEPWTHRSQKHSEKISTRRLRTTIMNDATHIFSELFCVIPNFDCHRSLAFVHRWFHGRISCLCAYHACQKFRGGFSILKYKQSQTTVKIP